VANYTQKLANMRSRRRGLDSLAALSKSAAFAADAATFVEAYESRAKTEAIKYALGAIQELEAKYTKISIEEGNRVRDQLKTGLNTAGIPVTFEYQGSVPLNVHIRFSSDIDLLVLHDGFVTVDRTGPRAPTYRTLPGSVLADMLTLRGSCESILEQKFPAVTVDKTGAKSIALSGGSLQRKVDVVPSHWHDTAAFQQSRAKHDREVKVLDKNDLTLVTNRPFLHMQRIEEKDQRTSGGTKKVIRLLKNLKKDSSQEIKLTSYDIAALVWHLNDDALRKPSYLELSLVAEVQKYLQLLADNPSFAKTLDVPDQSRKILDTAEKLQSLHQLKMEVDELAVDIAREINPIFASSPDLIQRRLMEAQIF
jgi:hypothetical protein